MSLRVEAEGLLRSAFPWGAVVELGGAGSFVSLRYEVVSADGADDVVVRFERNPGDTLQHLTLEQLRHAAAGGALVFASATVRQPDVPDVALLARPLDDFVGPQAASGSAWARRMRLHQSWWRAFRLRVPFGFGPNPGSRDRYGNMLEDDAAAQGRNFLTDDAWHAYEERLSVTPIGIGPWRTTRNLMASQPLAFNVFGHLRNNLEIARPIVAALAGEPVKDVVEIEIERLSDALGDKTAFDAFIQYVTADGSCAALAIETKLTEPFSQQAYDWAKYLGHAAFDLACWATADAEVLGDRRWSQIWRNHLLARAEAGLHPDIGTIKLIVVHHPADRHCISSIDGYRSLLARQDDVRAVDLAAIVEAARDVVRGHHDHEHWVADLRDRYLNLSLSEPLVLLLRRSSG